MIPGAHAAVVPGFDAVVPGFDDVLPAGPKRRSKVGSRMKPTMSDPSSAIELSVVIPVHNEEENILALGDELETALAHLRWECIWVDDASADRSVEKVRELLRRESSAHRLLRFPRRRGQSAALLAGFLAARGEFVGSLDGDRQNVPEDLVLQLDTARREGWDMVNGVRVDRHDSWIRAVSSKVGNGFRNRVTGDRISDVGCSTRVFRRKYVGVIPHFNGMHRFLPTFIRRAGGRVGEIPVRHRPRAGGVAKYGLNNRLWRGLADTFGVRWLARRMVRLDAEEELSS